MNLKQLSSMEIQDAVESGILDALEAYVEVYRRECESKAAREAIKEQAVLMFQREGNGQVVEKFGVKISKHTNTTYDYSNNPEYSIAKAAVKQIEDAMKRAHDHTQRFRNSEYHEGGVIVPPAIKKSSDGIAIKF
jgi:glutamyl/glutaminyl-tRNA synthetase